MNNDKLVLKLAMVTGEIIRRAQLANNEKTASNSQRPALITEAVDSLVKHERINPEQREKVASALTENPNYALTLLRDVARHRNSTELAIGAPTGSTKVASAEAVKRPVIAGARPVDFDDTEHGRRFAERTMNPTRQ